MILTMSSTFNWWEAWTSSCSCSYKLLLCDLSSCKHDTLFFEGTMSATTTITVYIKGLPISSFVFTLNHIHRFWSMQRCSHRHCSIFFWCRALSLQLLCILVGCLHGLGNLLCLTKFMFASDNRWCCILASLMPVWQRSSNQGTSHGVLPSIFYPSGKYSKFIMFIVFFTQLAPDTHKFIICWPLTSTFCDPLIVTEHTTKL